MTIEEFVSIPKKEYERLLLLVLQLQEEIRLLKNGKKSHTSHTSPSHDIGRGNSKSLREKSSNKPGGQEGHEGHTLKMRDVADQVIDYTPDFCATCARALALGASTLSERKQEIVIPPIQALCVEHRSYSIKCACGHINTSALPAHLKAPIQYGTSVSATVAYLFAYQCLPYRRIKIAMRDLFGITLSEGTIDNVLVKMTTLAKPFYHQIKDRLQQSDVVGGDETGTKINGRKAWFHVWQNPLFTFIVSAATRGYQSTALHFENGFSKAIYVSDCWSAQLKTPAQKHQLCLAHLLRELTNFEDALQCKWSSELKLLLKKAIALKATLQVHDYLHPPPSVKEIELQLAAMLDVDTRHFHSKAKAYVKRLTKNRASVFTFLYYPHVPYDNNGSERAIRNVKVKNKISGSFRSEQGANRFAVLRSVIDTTIKNGQDVFNALALLAKVIPE